jgi:hypothetical protein
MLKTQRDSITQLQDVSNWLPSSGAEQAIIDCGMVSADFDPSLTNGGPIASFTYGDGLNR